MSAFAIIIVFFAFVALAVASLGRPKLRAALAAQGAGAWILDLSGLFVQGALIPLVQSLALAAPLQSALPRLAQSYACPGWAAFLLAFVAVDYLYYWNHRLLHASRLWSVHRVHHSAMHMNVLVTSRNTVWASFLIVYVWSGALALFFFVDPSAYLLGAAAGSALDLWRHSGIGPRRGSRVERILARFFVTPRLHASHHGRARVHHNFGANFCLWDRLHKTYAEPSEAEDAVGIPTGLSWTRSLFAPFDSPEPHHDNSSESPAIVRST